MKKISHRGNISGPNQSLENNPEYVLEAIKNGYDVEIDVRHHLFDGLYLGHDYPKYKIDIDFLKNDKLWCHAKDLRSLRLMLINNIQCFWHQNDDYTLTSNNLIWTYPEKTICEKTIIVCRSKIETLAFKDSGIYGICTDYVEVL